MADNDGSPAFFHDAHGGETPPSNRSVTTDDSPASAIPRRDLFPSESDNVEECVLDDNNINRQPSLFVLPDVDMSEVEKDLDDCGDGGDSTCDANELGHLNLATAEANLERNETVYVDGDDGNNDVLDYDNNFVEVKFEIGQDVSLPKPPDDWVESNPKVELLQPPNESIDNPGDWDPYTFRPKFASKKTKEVKKGFYIGHKLPTKAIPVPLNDEGKRMVNDWEFHYKKWSDDSNNIEDGTSPVIIRDGATKKNLFPDERKGRLDYELLKKLGLTKERLLRKDAFFFYQLLFPICDPKKSGIEDDPRLSFYSECEKWTNKYAASIGLGGTYGHEFKSVTAKDLLVYDMVVVRDGVLGGSHGAIYRRWKKNSSTFDRDIASAMTHTRWLELKRTFKLCDNDLSPKKGEKNYDPAYKFVYQYKCLTKNVNEITEMADLDLTGDETTCGHGGYGEKGSGIVARRKGKPGITFGMQTVLVSDASRNRPRAYSVRHKLHVGPDGWNKEGPKEVLRICDFLGPMIIGEEKKDARQIFPKKPHFTWDNHFSGDQIMDYLGANGWGATMTCARNRLPAGVESKYMQKEKTDPGDKYAKVARFNNPITMVSKRSKMIENVQCTWTRVHVTFQSTSSTNISTVNALSENELYVRVKERGAGENKRKWAIEMNHARELYLQTYGRIDTIDALIKNCQLYYVSWKYWHASKIHVLGLALVTAYDLYKEIMLEAYAVFGLEEEQAKKLFLSFHEFREQLSLQGLSYNPKAKAYPGDAAMRVNTKLGKRVQEKRPPGRPKRVESVAMGPVIVNGQARVSSAMLKRESAANGRLNGDLTKVIKHCSSIKFVKHATVCAVCGDPCYTKCTICNVTLHDNPKKGDCKGRQCFLEFHSDVNYGLTRMDCRLLKRKMCDWTPPTQEEKQKNSRHIENLKRTSRYSLRSRSAVVSPEGSD